MKTVEFKLNLNLEQKARIDDWLNVQRWVWNKGLNLLEEFYLFHYWDKLSKTWNRCCPLAWKYRKYEDNWIPYCSIAHTSRDWVQCCPVNQDFRESPIDNPNYFGLVYYFAQKNHPDKPWFTAVPSKFVAGTCKALTDAYARFRKGDFGKIKYKRKQDKIHSLINNNAKEIKPVVNYLRVPKLGLVKVKGLSARWLDSVAISTLKISKEAETYYLQLTGNLPIVSIKPSNKACGLDVGLQYIYADDVGKVVEPPRFYRWFEKRLRRLQRQVSRQEKNSKNQIKTRQKIAKTHAKIKRQRRSFNHKLSTFLVRKFGGIAVENIQIKNLNRRPKPKLREDGLGWERNNATAKSGLNKSFADAGLGQLLQMTEQKAQVADREFVKVDPAYTSQTCPQCGMVKKKSLSQRTHQCDCGYIEQRDVAAAINIRAKANFVRIYPAWAGEVMPPKGIDKISAQEEPAKAGLSGDATPTSNQSLNLELQIEVRETVGVVDTCYPQTASNCLSQSTPANSLPPSIRAFELDPIQLEFELSAGQTKPSAPKRKTRSKRRSAQASTETALQLELWDVAAADNLESG